MTQDRRRRHLKILELISTRAIRTQEELADALAAEGTLKNYHLLPAVRADLLQGLGRLDEARSEFERAASLTRNGREQALLRARAAACASGSPYSSANQGIRSSR